MLYDAYEAKMQRIAAVLDKIRKYRVLILCCLALILLAIGAFLFFKGTLLTDAVAPSEPVLYGEKVDFRGKALFGRTKSQYKTSAGEWQDGFPIMPGEYTVRAVSRRSFGVKQYGAEQPLTIIKRPLSVSLSDSAIYGEYPAHSCEGLIAGDGIGNISVKYTDPYADSTDAVIEGITVQNGAGEDVTAGYEISFGNTVVVFQKRSIELKTESAEKIYDGLPLRAEGITVEGGSTAYGDKITYESYASLTDVTEGGIENRPIGLKIVNSEGADVTRMYTVTSKMGRLTVLARVITVSSNSAEKVYDASPIVGLSASVTDGTVAEGQKISYRYTAKLSADVGSYHNTYEATVTDGSGRDVSGNYSIHKEYGVLKITPRPVTVTGSDRTWVFDGLVHYASTLFPRFTVSNAGDNSGLVGGHSLDCVTDASVYTVGDAENTPTKIGIYDASGKDVTANYQVNAVSGKLTVVKRVIVVTAKDSEYVFTGEERKYPHEAAGQYFTVTQGEQAKLPDGMAEDTALADSYGPLGAREINIGVDFSGSIRRVGKVTVTPSVVGVYQGTMAITDCYDITVVSGSITVVPRKVTVTPEHVYGFYNGGLITNTGTEISASCEDTVPQEELTVSLKAFVTVSAGGITAGEYVSYIQSYRITDAASGEDVTDCFEVTKANGLYVIQQRPIKIVFADGTWVYDGLTHRVEGEDAYTVVSLIRNDTVALCEGHRIEIRTKGDITDVGTALHTIDGRAVIYDADGKDVTANYDVVPEDGTLTVTPRPITVKTGSGEKVYDGEPLTEGSYELISGELVSGHRLSVKLTGSQTVAGSSRNTAKATVSAGGRDVTSNYDISYDTGELKVTPRPITVLSGSADKMYDGTPLTEHSFELVQGSLIDGHTLDVEIVGSQTDAGKSENFVKGVKVFDGNRDMTSNYEIEIRKGWLTVDKRPVKMGVDGNSFTYDGLTHYAKDICVVYVIEEDGYYGLIDGHDVGFSVTFRSDRVTSQHSVRLAGEYTVTVDTAMVIDAVGSNMTENYEFTWESGYISVFVRNITVSAASGEFKYDGKTHYASELTPYYVAVWDVNPMMDGIGEGDVATVKVNGSITYPGTAVSSVEWVLLNSESGEDVSFCYSVTLEEGVLTMLPSEITVTSDSAEKVYDGEPLTAHSYTLIGVLYPGDRIEAKYTGSQTEIGESGNYFTYTVVNAVGKDVTDSYIIGKKDGVLKVTKKDGTVGGDLGGNVGNNKPDEDDHKTVFSYVATSDGSIYFRQGHFGNYDPIYGWLVAPAGEDKYSGNMIGDALIRIRPKETVTVKPVASMLYFSTYYADRTNYRDGRTDEEYSLDYCRYNWLSDTLQLSYSGEAAAYELACREFAYANYTDVPEETRVQMEAIIAEAATAAGVDLGSMSKKELVAWVCNYIKHAAVYDLEFPDFPEGVDKAIYFLTVAKRGVCRHYATSATVMYRTLGIPARYTVGYASSAKAGETVDVTGMNAHAWVEVYIDGLGWVMVDPTGGSGENGGEGGETPSEPTENKLVLVPYEIRKVYNGSTVSCGNDQFWIKSGKDLLPEGYRISVTIEGSRTKVGKSASRITNVTVYDADGNDITAQLDIECENGVIEVMPIKIVVYTASASKVYDGRRLSAEECYVSMGKLIDGHYLEASGYNYIVNIGSELNTVKSVRIYDKNGNDVTDCYSIEIREGTLTVTDGG